MSKKARPKEKYHTFTTGPGDKKPDLEDCGDGTGVFIRYETINGKRTPTGLVRMCHE